MDGRVAITTLSLYLIAVYCSVILGCSCPPLSGVPLSRSESLCQDYNRSSNVLVARVINASCNCAPSGNDDAFFQDITNVSCVSATLSTGGHVVTRVIVQATCNIAEDSYGVSSCASITNSFEPSECPYEGQEMMDCVPLCQNTCSNVNVDSPCPEVCIRGCGCPGSMVLDENRGRCVRQSQCPNANAACPIVGQVTTSCASACPPDCLRLSSGIIEPCPAVCARCDCAGDDEVVDYITGKCVRQEQCTACPIEGQVYTTCGSSCPLTCDNVNNITNCDSSCWQGCECPSGTVIDLQSRRCVQPSQCGVQPSITMMDRRNQSDQCTPRFVCPHNEGIDYNICQYTVEVTEVFKGTYQVGQILIQSGPDLETSCGNPRNILTVGTTYVIGVGGRCSSFSEWTPYSDYSSEDVQLLNNNCGGETGTGSSAMTLPSIVMLFTSAVVAYFLKL